MLTTPETLGMLSPAQRAELLAALLGPPPGGPPPDPPPAPRGPLAGLRFELLGPLSIRHGGRDVAPSAPKLRLILSALLFHANQPVGASTLVRELWSGQAPRTAHATLQTYMFKVRTLFGTVLGRPVPDVARDVLPTCSGGYTLRVDPQQLDVVEFDDLVSAGTRAMRAGAYERAADDLRRSLRLWRGGVLHQGTWGPVLRAQAARLNERRSYAHTLRIEADLCLGRHREATSELASLVVEHPLHESAHAMLMLALHRSGRTPAALQAYLQFRRRMRDELGIEPSARIGALHRALLAPDPLLTDRTLTSDALLDRLVRHGGAGARAGSPAVTG